MSEESDILKMNDCSEGTYICDMYFPAPYLYNEVDYICYSVLFDNSASFNRDLFDNDLFLNRYVTDDWLLEGVPVGIIRSRC